MLRSDTVSDADYDRLVTKLKAVGYNTDRMQKLPHDWSDEGDAFQRDGSEWAFESN